MSNTEAFEINNGVMLGRPGSDFIKWLIGRLTLSMAAELHRKQVQAKKEASLIQVLALMDPQKAD